MLRTGSPAADRARGVRLRTVGAWQNLRALAVVVGLTPRHPPCAAGPFPPPLPAAPKVSRLRRDLFFGFAYELVLVEFVTDVYVNYTCVIHLRLNVDPAFVIINA